MRRTALTSFFLVLVGFVAAAPAIAQERAPRLFVSAEKQPSPTEPGPWLQSWHIRIDQQAIQQPAEAITLNLPDQREVVVRLERWSPKAGYLSQLVGNGPDVIWLPDPTADPEEFAWEWYGRSEGYTVSIVFNYGVTAARIWTPEHKYALQPRPGDVTELAEVNPDWWEMHPEREQPEQASADAPLSLEILNRVRPSGSPNWNSSCPDPPPTASSVIDVLVMYTPAVFSWYGSTHAGVEAAVTSAIADANNSLRNSGINTLRFSLRGVEPVSNPESFNYDQPNIGNSLFHLASVTGETPGQYPGWTYASNVGVSNRRNAMWADVVALARTNADSNTCGASFVHRLYNFVGGWIEPGAEFERKSYLVFDPSCGVDRLNLAHELGHILGMEHDPLNTELPSSASPTCPWSFGHRNSHSNPNIGFRTVMAYPGGLSGWGPPCNGKSACPLIDAYSNPAYAWNGSIVVSTDAPGAPLIGVATGGAWGPAAKANDTFARLAPIVAAFRARPEVIFANGFQ